MIVSGCAEVGAGTAAFASSDSPGSGAVTKPVARVRITGAVHADYQVTDQRLCHTETFFGAYGIWMWFGSGGSRLPDLSVQKLHRHASTRRVVLASSQTLSVGFVAPHGRVWRAGAQKTLATGHVRNYGSGTVSANPALTKGSLNARLVWESGNQSEPVRVSATWNCAR